MREAHRAHERELMVEAFRAGWQAALAVRVTNPRVLAVIDSCFDLWLEEASDEVEVLGLPFRRRDLGAHPSHSPAGEWDPGLAPPAPSTTSPGTAAAFTGLGTRIGGSSLGGEPSPSPG